MAAPVGVSRDCVAKTLTCNLQPRVAAQLDTHMCVRVCVCVSTLGTRAGEVAHRNTTAADVGVVQTLTCNLAASYNRPGQADTAHRRTAARAHARTCMCVRRMCALGTKAAREMSAHECLCEGQHVRLCV